MYLWTHYPASIVITFREEIESLNFILQWLAYANSFTNSMFSELNPGILPQLIWSFLWQERLPSVSSCQKGLYPSCSREPGSPYYANILHIVQSIAYSVSFDDSPFLHFPCITIIYKVWQFIIRKVFLIFCSRAYFLLSLQFWKLYSQSEGCCRLHSNHCELCFALYLIFCIYYIKLILFLSAISPNVVVGYMVIFSWESFKIYYFSCLWFIFCTWDMSFRWLERRKFWKST